MNYFKWKGTVSNITPEFIIIKCDEIGPWNDMQNNLKENDRVDVLISKPQAADLEEYIRGFNEIFSR